MKKKIILGLECVILSGILLMTGCSSDDDTKRQNAEEALAQREEQETEDTDAQSSQISTEEITEEIISTEKISLEETTAELESEEETTAESENNPADTEPNIGDQVEVNTDEGDFLLTIDQVRKSDWVERNDGEADKYVAVLIEFDFENISFDSFGTRIRLEDYLSVSNEEGYVVSVYDNYYDDGLYERYVDVPIGSKGRLVIPYLCEINVERLNININGQYHIEAEVKDEIEEESTEEIVEETTEASEEESDVEEEQEDATVKRDLTSIMDRFSAYFEDGTLEYGDTVEQDGAIAFEAKYNNNVFYVGYLENSAGQSVISIGVNKLDPDVGSSEMMLFVGRMMLAVDGTEDKEYNSLGWFTEMYTNGSLSKNGIEYAFLSENNMFTITYDEN